MNGRLNRVIPEVAYAVPALLLADPPVPAEWAGWSSSGGDVTIGYRPTGTGFALRLRTLVRTGWRFDGIGRPLSVRTSLQGIGADAVKDLQLGTIRPGDKDRVQERIEAMVETSEQLGARLPGPPWKARPATVDGERYVLFVTPVPGAPGFAGVLDVGPVIAGVVGDGAPEDWDWTLATATPDRLRALPEPS